MALISESRTDYDWSDLFDSDVSNGHFDLSGWTNCQDTESHQKRSDIIHKILDNQCLDQLRIIVESGWDVNEELTGHHPQVPLIHAIVHSKKYEHPVNIVQLLLEHGANPNKVNITRDREAKWVQRTALHEAARLGKTELVKMLLDAGANCTPYDGLENPLALAVQNHLCPPDLIELLLKHGADPNDHDSHFRNIPLLVAIGNVRFRQNDTTIVQLLLVAGAKCKRLGALQNPLTLALQTRTCPSDLIELLLKYGVNPNDHDSQFGNIPLLRAINNCRYRQNSNDTTIVRLLLAAGAKTKMSHGLQNPLALALQRHNCLPDLIVLLLGHGADPNDHDGQYVNIPLLKAINNSKYCLQKSTNIVKLLLAHGANPNVQYSENNDNDNHTEHGCPLLDAITSPRQLKCATMMVQLLLEHGANPNVEHPVNMASPGEIKWVQRTALQEAARVGSTAVVEMLFNAGAKCTTSDGLQNPMALALQNWRCPESFIELLLKHGADPNDHDDQLQNIPLLRAIQIGGTNWPTDTVQLLLKHGANPNVTHSVDIGHGEAKWVHRTAIQEAAIADWLEVMMILHDAGATCDILESPLGLALQKCNSPPDVIELLLKHTDVPFYDNGGVPLLHRLTQYPMYNEPIFLQQELDLFFLHGANINIEYRVQQTTLEHAISECGHSNCLRWLIMHGADTAIRFSYLNQHFMPNFGPRYAETPLILLQAGMRAPHGAQSQLQLMEMAMSIELQNHTVDERNIRRALEETWSKFLRAEKEERALHNIQKQTFPEFWTRQMIDLEEFSDESLNVYPEVNHITSTRNTRQEYINMLYQIHRIQEFLSQPPSLQFYCRRCIRYNLVSLQSSVVKKLPGPPRLKRYILCHEI